MIFMHRGAPKLCKVLGRFADKLVQIGSQSPGCTLSSRLGSPKPETQSEEDRSRGRCQFLSCLTMWADQSQVARPSRSHGSLRPEPRSTNVNVLDRAEALG